MVLSPVIGSLGWAEVAKAAAPLDLTMTHRLDADVDYEEEPCHIAAEQATAQAAKVVHKYCKNVYKKLVEPSFAKNGDLTRVMYNLGVAIVVGGHYGAQLEMQWSRAV